MTLSTSHIAVLAAAWLAYAVVHSVLASLTVKRRIAARFPGAARGYRLLFNAVAFVLLVPPLWLTFAWRGPLLWRWSGGWGWLADALALAAIAGFVSSTRYYDMKVFAGTAQWRSREATPSDDGALRLSPLHRYVRHPWYAFALVILWTRDMDAARLTSTICVTLYFWLGSLLEERKLLEFHGDAYARYRQRVNGLVPWPGKILGAAEADALVRDAQALHGKPHAGRRDGAHRAPRSPS